jgi:hypothetical protein
MPLPREKPFERRPTRTGAFSTTCLHCRVTAGFAFWEAELDELEERHVCRIDNIVASSALLPANRPVRKPPQKQPDIRRKYA